jgi:hypothetical protein
VTLSEDMAIFDGAKGYACMTSPLDVFPPMFHRSVYHLVAHQRMIQMFPDDGSPRGSLTFSSRWEWGGTPEWACNRVPAFSRVFSVDSSPTWRGRRRRPG